MLLSIIIYIVIIFLSYYILHRWFPRNNLTYDGWSLEDDSIIWCVLWPTLIFAVFLVITVHCVCIPFHYMFSKIKELAERK